MESESQPVPAPELPEPVTMPSPMDPEATVSLMLFEAEMLRVAGAAASAAMPPIASDNLLRDLSPLGQRGL
jgi:hypothetical protein